MAQPNQTQQDAPQATAPQNGAAAGDARAQLIAELEGIGGETPAPATPSESSSVAEPGDSDGANDPEPPGEDAPADDSDDEDGDAPAEPEPSTEPDAAAEPDETDPKLAKNIEAINRREKRSLEKVAAEQRKLTELQQQLEREWAPRVEKVQRFEQLEARAKYDPAAVLEALGVDLHGDGELIARQIYSRSKAAAANPQTREAAERALREREQSGSLAQLQKQVEALQQQIVERDRKTTADREVAQYMARVEKAVDDETPLARTYLANDRDEALEAFAALAVEIADDTGEPPDHADVVKEWEKRRRAYLKKLGIDAPTKAEKTKINGKTVPGKPGGSKTLSNQTGSPTKPQSKEPPSRDELVRELQALDRS